MFNVCILWLGIQLNISSSSALLCSILKEPGKMAQLKKQKYSILAITYGIHLYSLVSYDRSGGNAFYILQEVNQDLLDSKKE